MKNNNKKNKESEQAQEKASDYGKFKSLSDLLNAYLSLESEFTKKSTSLSQLQAQLKNLEEEKKEDALNQVNDSSTNASLFADNMQSYLNDEDFIEKFILNNEFIKDRIIKEYLNSLSKNTSVLTLSSKVGGLPKTVLAKPKNLQEAKDLAEFFLSRK